jgi:CheY-like chemotaxis protein
VQSTLGAGSTFSAILPRSMAPTALDRLPVSAAAASGRTVLVVDDDWATLKVAEVALRRTGHRAICKRSALEALRVVEAEPPAVVIVDLLMPQVDGFEFISRLRALPGGRDIPVLVWTVKDLDAEERRHIEALSATIVPKSLGGSDVLVDQLRQLLPSVTLQ